MFGLAAFVSFLVALFLDLFNKSWGHFDQLSFLYIGLALLALSHSRSVSGRYYNNE